MVLLLRVLLCGPLRSSLVCTRVEVVLANARSFLHLATLCARPVRCGGGRGTLTRISNFCVSRSSSYQRNTEMGSSARVLLSLACSLVFTQIALSQAPRTGTIIILRSGLLFGSLITFLCILPQTLRNGERDFVFSGSRPPAHNEMATIMPHSALPRFRASNRLNGNDKIITVLSTNSKTLSSFHLKNCDRSASFVNVLPASGIVHDQCPPTGHFEL